MLLGNSLSISYYCWKECPCCAVVKSAYFGARQFSSSTHQHIISGKENGGSDVYFKEWGSVGELNQKIGHTEHSARIWFVEKTHEEK